MHWTERLDDKEIAQICRELYSSHTPQEARAVLQNWQKRAGEPLPPTAEVREMEIWSEGYRINGNSAGAQLLFKTKAKSFREAVEEFLQQGNRELFREQDGKFYIWGCQLFDNEEAARVRFG